MFQSLMRDKVTLVKKDGTVLRSDIPATVSTGQITTYAEDLPIEVGDHFLRELPNGLVDDYIVCDPVTTVGLLERFSRIIRLRFAVATRRPRRRRPSSPIFKAQIPEL